MHIRTADGVWTDGRWWHRIHLRDTRIVLVDEEELLVAELPSEDEAERALSRPERAPPLRGAEVRGRPLARGPRIRGRGSVDVTRLWLDDERDPREWLPDISWMRGRSAEDFEGWVWVQTAHEAMALIETGEVTEASLDHDLGDESVVGNGYQVVNDPDRRSFLDPAFSIPIVHVHTSNAGARTRMELAVKALERRAAERVRGTE
jgi:hypothetical protein